MKKTKTLLLYFILIFSVSSTLYANEDSAPVIRGWDQINELQEEVKLNTEKFIQLSEKTLAWRMASIRFYNEIKNNKRLSSNQITRIHKGTTNYIALRSELIRIVNSLKWVSSRDTKVIFIKSYKETKVERKQVCHVWVFCTDREKITVYLNPKDELGKLYVDKFKMGLATTMLLYDNYLTSIMPYQKVVKFRQLINQDHSDLKNVLKNLTESFYDYDNFKLVSRVIETYEDYEKFTSGQHIASSDLGEYSDTLIQGSYTYQKVPGIGFGKIIKVNTVRVAKNIRDFFKKAKTETLNDVSMVFGNTVGLIETRKGKMYKMLEMERTTIKNALKPLDILFEKTPFRATDKFIPGHWGHVAIWVGTKDEIIATLGKEFWNALSLEYQIQIEFEGRNIIEALRPGVQINTLSHFLNIDDFAAIRSVKAISPEKFLQYMQNSFNQIGKEYDFNFDVETAKKIVCSELAYVTYDDLDWPTERALARETISPDNVAILGLTAQNFERFENEDMKELVNPESIGLFKPVIIYHNGRRVENNLDEGFLQLMNTNYDFFLTKSEIAERERKKQKEIEAWEEYDDF
jgi:hypothetical protein